MPKIPLTAEKLWAIPRVGAPAVAPEGRFCVVPVATHSLDTNEGTTRLWLVPAEGAEPRPLTSADASASQPAVSPDGRWLAFIRKPGGPKGEAARSGNGRPEHPDQPQLYLMSLEGGEPERLTDVPLGAGDPRWLPEGSAIAFIAPVFAAAPTIEGTDDLAKAREKDPVKAFVSEDRVYRYWDRWLTGGAFHHVFAFDLASRKVTDLTPGSMRWFPMDDPSDAFRIAPDGRELAFSACRSEPPYDPIVFGVFTVALPACLDGSEPVIPARLLTADHPADAYRPIYSPDGKFILYGIQRELDFYADRVRLVAFDRKNRSHTVLTEAWDRSAEAWEFMGDSRTIVLRAEDEARNRLFALDLTAAIAQPAANPPRPLGSSRPGIGPSPDPDTTRSASEAAGWFGHPQPAGRNIFATLESLRRPPEVYLCGIDGRGLRRLTRFTDPALSEAALGEVEEITFTGAGGRAVRMFLMHPPGTGEEDETRSSGAGPSGIPTPLPLVHLIHGGPHGVFGDQWHWRWNAQVFAAAGWRVATVNFHGSTSWGQDFAASILGRWGDQPYQDILAATDHLVAAGLADPLRLAAAGGSYGGYLTSWIASQTDRFACIVNHAGVCDFQTQYASDVTQGRRRSMGGEPWDDIAGMDRFNPMRHARGFRSPMLVLHGERDYRVPCDQALEIYNVYKAMGLPARLVCYPDENHWVLKPRNSVHWYGEVLGWMKKWLEPA